MLISEEYRQLNTHLHIQNAFGVSGYKWGEAIAWIAQHHQITHILDYGAGQQTLKKSLAEQTYLKVDCYDPAIPELAATPRPTEMVTCTDVLEHIEPEHIDAVLDDIQRIAIRSVFLVIPTGPAAKTLADGRNAHILQQPIQWWLPKIIHRFDLVSVNHMTDDIVILASKKSDVQSNIQKNLLHIIKMYDTKKIQHISYDGLYWHLSIKSKDYFSRTIARFFSIIKLGKKCGVAEKIKIEKTKSKFIVTSY